MPPNVFENVINWIREGYPEGVPPTDYPPLFALLSPVLSEQEITEIVITMAREHGVENPATPEAIAAAVHEVTESKPSSAELRQVAARLAAAGWPLDATLTAEVDDEPQSAESTEVPTPAAIADAGESDHRE